MAFIFPSYLQFVTTFYKTQKRLFFLFCIIFLIICFFVLRWLFHDPIRSDRALMALPARSDFIGRFDINEADEFYLKFLQEKIELSSLKPLTYLQLNVERIHNIGISGTLPSNWFGGKIAISIVPRQWITKSQFELALLECGYREREGLWMLDNDPVAFHFVNGAIVFGDSELLTGETGISNRLLSFLHKVKPKGLFWIAHIQDIAEADLPINIAVGVTQSNVWGHFEFGTTEEAVSFSENPIAINHFITTSLGRLTKQPNIIDQRGNIVRLQGELDKQMLSELLQNHN